MKRREFITLLGGTMATWPLTARAQQGAVPVIGMLRSGSTEAGAFLGPFRRGLGETGYSEGQNVTVEYRWAEDSNDRLSLFAADLVKRQVSVIVAPGIPAAVAAKAATKTIPIVFSVGDDPVKSGLVASLNRPGGNATGINFFTTALVEKRLGLLHELMPRSKLVAVLVNPNSPYAAAVTRDLQEAARTIGKRIEILYAGTNRDIETVLAALAQKGADALLISPDPLFTSRRVQIVTHATRQAIPAIYPSRQFVEAGGLMSYGATPEETNRQVGIYTGRILKGEKPADLPVVQSTRFQFLINLQTARALGIDIPPTLLARADEVVE